MVGVGAYESGAWVPRSGSEAEAGPFPPHHSAALAAGVEGVHRQAIKDPCNNINGWKTQLIIDAWIEIEIAWKEAQIFHRGLHRKVISITYKKYIDLKILTVCK